MKRFLSFFIFFGILICSFPQIHVYAEKEQAPFNVNAKSAVLMEATTGTILFAQNESEALPPASVTKIMTLLLVMEAIEEGRIALEDTVLISKNAASMGGSQVFMKEGEEFTVNELLKCCVIASANDAAVALAEYVCGSESVFISRMNEKARELGLTSTKFENATGLDDTTVTHLTSAKDIAVMSRALIKHEKILEYSRLWQDSIRDGAFILTNTNRLVRFYKGCTGLKTGSTEKAGYCVSVTAERDGLSLICVVMGADSRDERNAIATSLMDYGFANYGVYSQESRVLESIPVLGGTKRYVSVKSAPFSAVIKKNGTTVECIYEIPEYLSAPVKEGDAVGKIYYEFAGERIGESDITVCESVQKIKQVQIFYRMLINFIMGPR
ncbi:MAG: D-alanyl-D-alanine carboxypeptidase [Clostridia bacterium]|nr:D-alanyl-D-alanine carboxypeptidase [Clostridia bacterium]